jgi:hypothetical protein
MDSARLTAMIRAPSPQDSAEVRKFYVRQNDLIVGMVKMQQVVRDGGHVDEAGATLSGGGTSLLFAPS